MFDEFFFFAEQAALENLFVDDRHFLFTELDVAARGRRVNAAVDVRAVHGALGEHGVAAFRGGRGRGGAGKGQGWGQKRQGEAGEGSPPSR
jgi:hypothetical protein